MALSDADWNRLDRMRSEDRNHLDSVTEKLDSDSVRQWQHIAALRTDFEVHKEASKGAHEQPCQTAIKLVEKHVEESPAHNPKKTIAVMGTLLTIAGTIGGGVAWFVHWVTTARPHPIIIFLPLLLAAGCSGKNAVLEEDRVLLDMTKQIIELQSQEITKLEDEISQLQSMLTPAVIAKLLPIRDNLRHLNSQAAGNLAVFVDNWGAPGVAQLYSDEANAKAREAAKAAHSTTFWATLSAGILAGATAIIGLLRSPLARLVPGVGQFVAAFDPLLAGVEKFMATQKASGDAGAAVAVELASHLISEQQMAKVDKFVTKRLDKVKNKISDILPIINETSPDLKEETKILSPS